MADLVKVSRARQLLGSGEGRRMREKARLSLREMADMIGIDHSSLARWETGESLPGREPAQRWHDAMRSLGALD